MTRLESPFLPWADLSAEPLPAKGSGALDGLRLAVKDVFDLAGYATGGGNPTWLTGHPGASRDADAVATLREAGAVVVGKTHTDELAYSLAGSNFHYGDLDNPMAPGRTPGGSSSGSAVAVAAGLADVGLGTDTAGSIRVPAAWCGLYGLRPTWGRIRRGGVMALGPSHDTVGVLTRSLELLATTAGLLLDPAHAAEVRQFLVPDDVWLQADPDIITALTPALGRLKGVLPVQGVSTLLQSRPPSTLVRTFGTTQGAQAWKTFGPWVRSAEPELGPDVRARLEAAAALTPGEVAVAQRQAGAARAQLLEVLQGRVMVIPTVPVAAPTPEEARTSEVRNRLLALTVAASIGGLPALSIPLPGPAGAPVGLCLVGSPGTDEQLLTVAAALAG
ncbi:MAG: amidase [Frankiales bacterium]|nr:amidase [Frankiales bacterium]